MEWSDADPLPDQVERADGLSREAPVGTSPGDDLPRRGAVLHLLRPSGQLRHFGQATVDS